MANPPTSMADRLDDVMRQRNIRSQSELARVADVPQSTVNRILTRGTSYMPAWATVKKLADALGVSALWLTDGDEAVEAASTAAPVDAPLDGWQLEALRILASLDEVDRRKVMGVLRLLERPVDSDKA
jgi:transcriptional regulator with XRE-family HTH domain